eukprot:scaffold8396_cov90-Cylindrotheca_fusiformis.AAC.2
MKRVAYLEIIGTSPHLHARVKIGEILAVDCKATLNIITILVLSLESLCGYYDGAVTPNQSEFDPCDGANVIPGATVPGETFLRDSFVLLYTHGAVLNIGLGENLCDRWGIELVQAACFAVDGSTVAVRPQMASPSQRAWLC